jgi:hypothetical protein
MLSFSVTRTVVFDDCVTVYIPIDWPLHVYHEARKGPVCEVVVCE